MHHPFPTRRGLTATACAAALTLPLLAGTTPAFAEGEDPLADHLVAHYALDETSGTVAADSSGNGLNGTYIGSPTLRGAGGVGLDGTDDYVDLPDNLMTGLDAITVTMDVLIDSTQATPYFIYALGNPATSSAGNGYLFSTGNNYRGTVSLTHWAGEQNANSGAALTRGTWHSIAYSLDGATDTATLYLDGVQVAQNTAVTVTPGAIGAGTTTANFIGKSSYSADKLLKGGARDFRIYDTALTSDDIAALAPSDADRVDFDLAALALGNTSAVTGNLTLPTTGANGSTIAWASSDTAVISTSGTVTRPAAGEADATVTLTATATKGSETDTRVFTVTVLAMPNDPGIAQAAIDAIVVNNADDARGNITLPAESQDLAVSWSSSNTDVVTTEGVVTRPETDTEVTLTASITKGAATVTRDIAVHVKAAVDMEPFEGYAFSYFTGNSVAGEKIYLAASDGNDALTWDELNGGAPLFESTLGTTGLRDPFIIRSPEGDTFYMIATDLSIGSGTSWDSSQRWGSTAIEIWESHDLVTWSEQRHVQVAPDNAGNVWAPEAYYDSSIGAYIVFWASKLYDEADTGHTGSTYNRMMYAVTRDFITFEPAQIWQDDTRGYSRIDTTVLEEDGTYYRFTKDEGAAASGCTDIMQESSDSLRAPLDEWNLMTDCIGQAAGTRALEGPTIFKSNPGDVNGDKYYLFVDEYGGRGFLPLETDDLANPDWAVSADYDLPASPRHGTVFPVTGTELAALRELIVTAPEVVADEHGQVLRYDFEQGEGTTLTDVTGNGYDGVINGGTSLSGGSMVFDGTDDYVKLPDNILSGIEDITVEAKVKLSAALSGNYFIYGLGNTTGGVGDGYLFTTGNSQYRTSIATGNWSTEQTVGTGAALARDTWVTLTYTLEGDTATLFLDGVPVKTGTVTTDPGDIGGGFTSANYLGESNYSADGFFRGEFAEFAIYNRALSSQEVRVNVHGVADVAALEEALDAAGAVDRDLYTSESLATLDDAVTDGLALLGAAGDQQAQVDDAVAALEEALAGLDEVVVTPPVTLTDIAGNPFKMEIEWLAATGVTTGWSTGGGTAEFRPLTNVNRDQMAAFLYRMAGEPEFSAPAVPTFSDVPATYVFYKEIEWLATQGITEGWTVDGVKEFRPKSAVKRDVMAAFLYRFAGSPEYTAPAVSAFSDVKTTHVFYKEISWLASTGISQGWTVDGVKQFRPVTNVKRDVMAAFLYRYAAM